MNVASATVLIGAVIAITGLVTFLRGIQPTHTDTRLVVGGGTLFAIGAIAVVLILLQRGFP
jgi:hypothetical protein